MSSLNKTNHELEKRMSDVINEFMIGKTRHMLDLPLVVSICGAGNEKVTTYKVKLILL